MIIAVVALFWSDKANRTVAMLGVVPAYEPSHPDPGMLQTFERVARVLGMVFERAEQGFGKRIM